VFVSYGENLEKYSADGDLLWSEPLPGAFLTNASADGLGNVFIAGQGNQQTADVYKYDSLGNLVWSAEYDTSAYLSSVGRRVSADDLGNVYSAGHTATGNLGTRNGVFLAKHDAEGELQWFRQLDSVTQAEISADDSGNVYLVGNNFPRSDEQYLVKYNAAGELLWTSQLLPYGEEGGSIAGIAAAGSSNVYLSGNTLNDLGGPNIGNSDAFVAKFGEVPGDFNDDGSVDAADYVVWRKGFSSGAYTEDDNSTWRRNFGAPAAGAAAGVASSNGALAPEPAGAALGLLGLACFAMQRTATRGRCRRAHIRSTT
jgi:hypothetical protein